MLGCSNPGTAASETLRGAQMAAAKSQTELFEDPADPPGYQGCLSAIDHFGFRTARDWLSDQFFPGFASRLTRARYFYLVPWLLQGLERRKFSGRRFLEELRRCEVQLIHDLVTANPDAEGIIGREARGQLRVMPSALYWRGLRTLGICHFQGSLEDFAQRLRRQSETSSLPLFVEEEPLLYGAANLLWCPGLPPAPSDFPRSPALMLSPIEAADLAERIQTQLPYSLAAVLLRSTVVLRADKLWSPSILNLLDERLQGLVRAAGVLSHCRRGCALLAAVHGPVSTQTLLEELSQSLEKWQHQAAVEMPEQPGDGILGGLLKSAGVPVAQRSVLETWFACLSAIAKGETCWKTVDVGRLFQHVSQAAASLPVRTRVSGNPGRDDLGDYRWHSVRGILNEIIEVRSSPVL